MGKNSTILVGSQVWVEDEQEAWLSGEVVNVEKKKVTVRIKGKEAVYKASSLHPVDLDVPDGGVDDMTKLAYLHEPGVLSNLRTRYSLDAIYTYTGSILIAVNPFMRLPHLYNSHMMDMYKGARLGELSPHVFAIADTAYRAMTQEGASQSILVSGESGAGKTETTKLIMQYLAYMGGRVTEGRSVEAQVLESNPLLEAFGNAKTVRNNNSSRFGKFVEIQFDSRGRISGAAVRTYLLERSRVVQISDPERNYHCFYQLCSGATDEERERLKLLPAEEFHYLNQSRCFDLPGKESNAKEYERTRRAMDIVGLSLEEQDSIFRVVAAILHLGNISFAPGKETDSSKISGEKSKFHLDAAAGLLGCDKRQLRDSLITRTLVTREGNIRRDLDPEAAVVSRDTLAKTLYARLFDWLVDKINKSIGQDPTSKMLIGVLDIYGFESFQINSFEQFCINLANEKLQQHFNQHVFKSEQEEYEREEIDWSYIEFVDNQDVLELIEKKPMGILALLDEQCMFPKSTPETFATKLFQVLGTHRRLERPKLSQTGFIVDHYAGQVSYSADLFLEKNKDFVVMEHQALLGNSRDPFVAGLFPAPEGDRAKTKFTSLGTSFKQQLAELMTTLNATEPHYIRCVKPNGKNQPAIFENANVLHQLRCGGVLEAIRISCAGYPTRRTFDEFLDRFAFLVPQACDNVEDKVAVTQLLQTLSFSNFQVGKSKVFLRAGQMADLDNLRTERLTSAARIIQRHFRTWRQQKAFRTMRRLVLQVQALWRGFKARQLASHLRRTRAATIIQKHQRSFSLRREFQRQRQAAIAIQAAARGMAARKRAQELREQQAAVKIQSTWRRHCQQREFSAARHGAVVLQSAWRARTARLELKQLKFEARQTGALQAAKTKLEKQCEELTWRLQLEKRMRMELEEAKAQELQKLQEELNKTHRQLVDAQEDARLAREEAARLAREMAEREAAVAAQTGGSSRRVAELEDEAARMAAEQAKVKEELEQEKQVAEERRLVLESLRKEMEASTAEQKRLQEKNASLEERIRQKEQETQVLRQTALTPTLPGKHAPRMPLTAYGNRSLGLNPHENGAVGTPVTPDGRAAGPGYVPGLSSMERYGGTPQDTPVTPNEVETRRQKMLHDRQKQDEDALIRAISSGSLGFDNGRPVAALLVFRCLLQWRSFEAERTSLFDRIIQALGAAVESEEDGARLAYWLAATATLLGLLQRTLRATGGVPGGGQRAGRRAGGAAGSLMGRMSQSFRGSPASPGSALAGGDSPSGSKTVEAKYPALLFKQQLTAYVEKIYGMIRDNLKRDISPLLANCIQAPRASRGSYGRQGRTSPNPVAGSQAALSSHWSAIISALDTLLTTLQAAHVPAFLVRKLVTQVFSFVNVQLFNSLLLRRECCSFSNGEYVKAGLQELEVWVNKAGPDFTGTAWEELKFIRQAVNFLVLHQKPKKSLAEITGDLCPSLSVQQLYRISTMYWDDKYGTHSVSTEVISEMRVKMTEESNSTANSSFLLDDDSAIPFTVDDVSKSIPDFEMKALRLPSALKSNSSFHFLLG